VEPTTEITPRDCLILDSAANFLNMQINRRQIANTLGMQFDELVTYPSIPLNNFFSPPQFPPIL